MPALLIPLLCLAELILFLLPGVAAILLFSRTQRSSAIASIVISAALGYAAFWIYLTDKTAGQVFSYGITAAVVAVVVLQRQQLTKLIRQPDFFIPFVYVLCLAVFSLSLLYLWVNPLKAGVDVANFRFFFDIRAGDNIIPFIFAQRLYDHVPVRPFCCGDWLSSDRPPLQAGIFLLQRPLRVAGNTGLQYQVLGTVLQCFWVCGVWTFLRALGVPRLRAAQALGLLLFSGFLFYNDVYVWPKLLAACFILFVLTIIGPAAWERRRLTGSETVLAAASFVLALLAHPGAVFSAPAIALILIVRRGLFSWKQAAWAALIAIVGIVPWTMYQKFYDPPGNRLLKMHLAGEMDPDSRGTLEALKDSYGRIDAARIVTNKLSNIRQLIGNRWLARVAQREFVWSAIGILNLGWLVALFRKGKADLPYLWMMIAFAGINLLLWCLILFGPAQTMTEHGSYADILLLSLGLIGFLLALPKWIRVLLVWVQVINLLAVWVLYRPASFVLPTRAVVASSLQWPMIILSVIFGVALLLAATFPHTLFKQETDQRI